MTERYDLVTFAQILIGIFNNWCDLIHFHHEASKVIVGIGASREGEVDGPQVRENLLGSGVWGVFQDGNDLLFAELFIL